MYQFIYASISHTHYWHEVGMLYLFTMVVACTLVRWMHSHPAAEKFNVQHAPKSLCCLKKIRTRLDLLSIPQYCVVVSLLYREGG